MAYITLQNVQDFQATTLKGTEISDVLNSAPLVKSLPVVVEQGTQHKYFVRTTNPTGGFRAINDGKTNTASTRTLTTLNLKFMDASFDIDIAAYKSAPGLYGSEAAAALEGGYYGVEAAIINGDSGAGVEGLADATDDLANTMVVNAGGSTASTGSSVYAIYANPNDGVALVVGANGVVEVEEPVKVSVAGSGTGEFTALRTNISAWAGIKVGGAKQVGRICNLTEQTGKGLTDALISTLVSKFPAGKKPTHLVMDSRSIRQLQQSRTATNATGTEAPYPTEVFGCQILVTDAITNTEAIMVEGSGSGS